MRYGPKWYSTYRTIEDNHALRVLYKVSKYTLR